MGFLFPGGTIGNDGIGEPEMSSASRPADIRYTATHEWARIEGDFAVIGITDYAVTHLSDLVFLQLPEVGARLAAGGSFGEIESVKAVAELNSPLSGEAVEVNSALADNLEALVRSPFEDGWLVKIRLADPSESERLLDLPAYEDQIRKEAE
jgi:glycine cleavage system H protein